MEQNRVIYSVSRTNMTHIVFSHYYFHNHSNFEANFYSNVLITDKKLRQQTMTTGTKYAKSRNMNENYTVGQ